MVSSVGCLETPLAARRGSFDHLSSNTEDGRELAQVGVLGLLALEGED